MLHTVMVDGRMHNGMECHEAQVITLSLMMSLGVLGRPRSLKSMRRRENEVTDEGEMIRALLAQPLLAGADHLIPDAAAPVLGEQVGHLLVRPRALSVPH